MNKIEIGAVKLRQAVCAAFPNHNKKRIISAVVTAAGNGERMGGISKPLYPLNGLPCLAYVLRAFQDSLLIDEIIVVVRQEDREAIEALIDSKGFTKVSKIVLGGKNRAESVKNGFFAIRKDADLVAIQDGDRPLITTDQIQLVIKDAVRYGAATAASHVTDSVKQGSETGMILRSVPRDDLYTVQTPQIFLADMYRVSLAKAQKSDFSFSDDNSLVEQSRFKVKLCVLDGDNTKLTFPADAKRIELVLKERKS